MVTGAVFLLLLVATANAADPPFACLNPPGNGAIADIIVNVLNSSRPIIAAGIPDLGIPPLDPMGPFPHIGFHIDVDGLWMDFNLNNTLVMNLAQFIICQVNVSLGIKQQFDLDLMLDNFHIEGVYDLDGLIASLFPVFGAGNFRLDTYNAGFYGSGKLGVNIISSTLVLSDFSIDIFFETLDLELEAILGGGDMADLVNSVLTTIAPAMFDAVWGVIQPILSQAIEDGINNILAGIPVAEYIEKSQLPAEVYDKQGRDIGNANTYMDLVMATVDTLIILNGLDPAALPNTTVTAADADVVLYNGELVGLSTLHRTGTCTLDVVADWNFLYANIGLQDFSASYTADVKVGGSGPIVDIGAKISEVAVYFVARRNSYTQTTDMDQFVINQFGPIDVTIDGLGAMDYLVEPITEAIVNLLSETISDMLETTIKDLILQALDETPWPLH